MALATVTDSGLMGAKGRRLSTPNSQPWSRPTDWVALPSVSEGEQKFVGLYAVYDHDSNFVALSFTGAYIVDWGDGSAPENFASGVQANHVYIFSSLLAETLTSGGYRQAVITVTMQAGQIMTGANLLVRHPSVAVVYSTRWLDIRMAAASLTSLSLGGTGPVIHAMLQRFEYIGISSLVSLVNVFYNCRALGRVVGTSWTASVINFTNTFYNCFSLQTVPLFNTAAGTIFTNLFNGCYSLQTVPLLNTAAGTNFTGMFVNCFTLQTIPLLNTAAGTNFTSMFINCYSLQTIPLLNTAAGTIFTSMFYGCTSLQIIPLLNTVSGINFTNTFYNCFSLQTIPLLNTAAGTNFTSMFINCFTLQTIPLLNTAAGTIFTSMFHGCYSLQTVPLLNTAAGTTFINMFNSCYSLQTLPLLNTAAGTDFTNMFFNCNSLAIGALAGTRFSISYASCVLSAIELNRVYTNLAANVTGQTITVTSNWGIATDDPSIATLKGWAVAGS